MIGGRALRVAVELALCLGMGAACAMFASTLARTGGPCADQLADRAAGNVPRDEVPAPSFLGGAGSGGHLPATRDR